MVEVLSPQDCLKHPSTHGLLSLPMKHHHSNLNPNPNRASRPQPSQRKSARPNSTSPVEKSPILLTGPVKILKRGEELAKENLSPPKQIQQVPDLLSTVGPKKQTRLADPVTPALGFYAGSSSCVPSPPPSSVPLPSFFAKKSWVPPSSGPLPSLIAKKVSNTDEASGGILKLLGLNLS